MQREFPVLTHSVTELSAIQQTQQTNIVVKSNILIRKGCYKLTPTQQKAVCYLISTLKDTDTAETVKEYDILNLCDVLGIPLDTDYKKQFCETIKAIASRRWWWIDDKSKDRYLMGFLNKVCITADDRLKITFNADILPYLQNLKSEFTEYRIINILNMKSAYSMQIYEIVKSAESLGKWYSKISYLKLLLDCENYDFDAFKKKVIIPSLAEINSKSDITVDYALYKKGRSYVAIEFYITTKSKTEKLQTERETRNALDNVLLRNHKGDYHAQERPTEGEKQE